MRHSETFLAPRVRSTLAPALLIGLLIRFTAGVDALASDSTSSKETYYSEFLNRDREYWLYLPNGFDDTSDKLWPMILFLHGNGERGDDPNKVLKHGPIKEVAVKKRDLPFIIVAPQMHAMPADAERDRTQRPRQPEERKRLPMTRAPSGEEIRWGSTGPPHGWHELEEDLLLLVDRTIKKHRADPDRIYLTGLSYGGFGTWYMAARHPELWAAAAPFCGAGDLKEVHKIGKLPVWLFQGGRDTLVRPEWTVATADALDAAGGNLRVTVHEDLGHDCWTRGYEGEDLYNWFAAHTRCDKDRKIACQRPSE